MCSDLGRSPSLESVFVSCHGLSVAKRRTDMYINPGATTYCNALGQALSSSESQVPRVHRADTHPLQACHEYYMKLA